MLLTKTTEKSNSYELPQLTILDSDGRQTEETGSKLTKTIKSIESVSSGVESDNLVEMTIKRAHIRMGFGPLLSVLDNYLAA